MDDLFLASSCDLPQAFSSLNPIKELKIKMGVQLRNLGYVGLDNNNIVVLVELVLLEFVSEINLESGFDERLRTVVTKGNENLRAQKVFDEVPNKSVVCC